MMLLLQAHPLTHDFLCQQTKTRIQPTTTAAIPHPPMVQILNGDLPPPLTAC